MSPPSGSPESKHKPRPSSIIIVWHIMFVFTWVPDRPFSDPKLIITVHLLAFSAYTAYASDEYFAFSPFVRWRTDRSWCEPPDRSVERKRHTWYYRISLRFFRLLKRYSNAAKKNKNHRQSLVVDCFARETTSDNKSGTGPEKNRSTDSAGHKKQKPLNETTRG